MYITVFFVSFVACAIGRICGMGGGVIIKPVLDAFHILNVSTINFLSGCTVIGMSCWSVMKSFTRNDSCIELAISTPLAIGAALGGIIGKQLYSSVAGMMPDAEMAGGAQAFLLFFATLGTLIYTVFKNKIQGKRVKNPFACVLIGFFLGMLGAFLGIGGGPFNMAVLYFFFSMTTKTAAQNSLYIILISQTASVLKTVLSGSVPAVTAPLLLGMILFGVIGSEAGGRLNGRMSERRVTALFELAMVLVMGICVYNMAGFL